MQMRNPSQLTTPGVIADRLSQPLHRVLYILKTRPHIQPTARAGRLRLYDDDAVDAVRRELSSSNDQNGGAA